MAKRNGNGKRGRRGGGGGDDGSGRARGRARGGGRGIPGSGSYLMNEALDVNIQMYADAQFGTPPYGGGRGGGHARQLSAPNSEPHTPSRGRGRGFRGRGRRGHSEMNFRNRNSDIGFGASPSIRGRGGGTQKLRLDAPLSRLLYEDRPLLRPIVFVPSAFHPVLFDQDEDLLKPGVEEVGDTEQSHLPTAAAVSRVFSGGNIQAIESCSEADNDDDDGEEIEVVDFNDVGKLFEEQTKNRKKNSSKKSSVEVVEKQFIGAHSLLPSTSSIHRAQHDLTDFDSLTKRIDENASAAEKSQEDDVTSVDASHFYIDTEPTPIPAEIAPSTLFPSDEFDDDIIVYVAPHPRKGIQTSPERQPSTNGVPDTSEFTPYVRDASFSLAVASSSSTKDTIERPTQPQPQPQTQIPSISPSFPTPEGKTLGRLSVLPVTISHLAISRKRKKGVLKKKGGKRTRRSFRAYGAMHEEAQLHDPKWKERRRGDSDLDWGDTDGDDDDSGSKHDHIDGVESPSSLVHGNGDVIGKDKGKGKAREDDDGHGMEVDSDLDLHAMQQFVGGLLGEDAGRHVTMDDLRDEAGEERTLEKDEDTGEDSRDINESESDESSEDEDEEVERVLADEEAMLISETLEFEDEDDGSEDEDQDQDQTPRTSFQQRLERLRKQASSSKHDNEHDISDDDDDDMLERQMLFAENNKSYFDLLIDSDEEFDYFNHKKSKRRAADLPDDLKIQWEKDRLKKAAFKEARYQARLEAAADPLSLKKGGKKGRKAMLAVASIDPTITVLPNRIIDMLTLVQQIKRFIDDEGRQNMALPPTDKATRKNIHDLAVAFNMKSISKGHGDARYTTLTKTKRSGLDVDENRVAKIVRRKNYPREKDLFVKKRGKTRRGEDSFDQDKKGKKSRTGAQAHVPRHREGDEVGKAAPKLGSSNLGFRMLAMMGWSEGERIGITGGLQDPLTAIIKNTKLGLGAAK